MPTENSPFSPFVLCEYNGNHSLILSDMEMEAKMPVFEEQAESGWNGNGYDWTSITNVVIAERIPELRERISFDSEAGMLCALGAKDDLVVLANAMVKVFNSDEQLRDLLSRAELD